MSLTTRVTPRHLAFVVAVITTASCAGCRTTLQPLEHATLMRTLPPEYVGWWTEVEQCSGLSMDLSHVQFYEYDSDTIPRWGGDIGSLAEGSTNRIFFSRGTWRDKNAVQHEALHLLTFAYGVGRWKQRNGDDGVWGPDHPPKYFGVHHFVLNRDDPEKSVWTTGGLCSGLLNQWEYLPIDRPRTW